MEIATRGIDHAKCVFQMLGGDERGKMVLRKLVRRDHVVKFMAKQTPCPVGVVACGSAHYCERTATALSVRRELMSPQFSSALRESQQQRPC